MNPILKMKRRLKTGNPDVLTLQDWLGSRNMHLARWKTTWDSLSGNREHILRPLSAEETEAVLEQYLNGLGRVPRGTHAKRGD